MEDSGLRKWVEHTIFIDPDTKKKLLSMPNWSDSIFSLVKKMFDKYAEKELEILNYMFVASNQAYIETINEIEQKRRNEEFDELILLEKELEKVG